MAEHTIDDKTKGNVNQAVGAAREKLGDAVGAEGMEAKGAEQHAKGDLQEATGKAKDALHSVADKVKKAIGQ
jgi:uncharacterized protein YjbJ (UPF0337 family)